jgi:Ner family transcriptional regulator
MARKDWFWGDVKAALERRGESVASVARAHGLHRATLCGVKTRRYPHAQKIIADALSMRPEQIWPERYSKNGARQ